MSVRLHFCSPSLKYYGFVGYCKMLTLMHFLRLTSKELIHNFSNRLLVHVLRFANFLIKCSGCVLTITSRFLEMLKIHFYDHLVFPCYDQAIKTNSCRPVQSNLEPSLSKRTHIASCLGMQGGNCYFLRDHYH